MAEITTLYWRDIPAQVIAGRGRRAAKHALPQRFEQAIDRCAMKVGARDSDAYLAEWRRVAEAAPDGADPDHAARLRAEALDAEHDDARLRALIENDGWAERPV